MVEQVESALPEQFATQVPKPVENFAAVSLHFGYGMTFGSLYAAMRPKRGNLLIDGMVLGVATWVVGYLGWLPQMKLMSPIHTQKPKQVLGPIAGHVFYGIMTVAAVTATRKILERA